MNVKGTFLALKHGIPLMLEGGGGVVVNNASPAGNLFYPRTLAAYAATKAAVVSLTRTLAPVCAKQGIRHYAVCPFTTETPMLSGSAETELTDEQRAYFGRWNPGGKVGKPEEVAELILALLKGKTVYANGDIILIDCGATRKLASPQME